MKDSPASQILLLTGTRPGHDGVGAILLSDQLGFLPPGSVDVVHVVTSDEPVGAARLDVSSRGFMTVSVPRHKTGDGGRLHRFVRSLSNEIAAQRGIKRAIEAICAHVEDGGTREVWAVLDTPQSIQMAPLLARALRVPLKAMVWDDIEHQIMYFGLGRVAARHCRRAFVAALRDAATLAVIGESMRDAYEVRFGKRGTIVRHGVAPPKASAMDGTSDVIRIGFAGSVTARSAFDCLLAALDQANWMIDGRLITLVLMGGRFDLRSNVPRRIEYLGWRSPEETLAILASCTVNYLPQPFELDWRAFAELSFPSKASTYLAAGVPILVQAPEWASLPRFNVHHPFAVTCTELDPRRLLACLQSLVTDGQLRTKALAGASATLEAAFSVERFRKDFMTFIDGCAQPDAGVSGARA